MNCGSGILSRRWKPTHDQLARPVEPLGGEPGDCSTPGCLFDPRTSRRTSSWACFTDLGGVGLGGCEAGKPLHFVQIFQRPPLAFGGRALGQLRALGP